MIVYRIQPDVDNYRSLISTDGKVVSARLLAFDGSSKKANWPEPLLAQVDNAKAPEPDILDLGAGNLVLHGKSWELLEPALRGFCEFLLVSWGQRSGYAANVIGLVDCLDSERTKWVLDDESDERIDIEEFEFFEDRIPSSLMFKIEEEPFILFCTERLKGILEGNDISGLNFLPVWTSTSK